MTVSARSFGAARGQGASTVAAALRRAAGWPVRVYRARALMHRLAGLEAHELRDIGLTPGDLRDAAALGLDVDPSSLLRRRAAERRRSA